jgi:hypothetical protein
MAKQTVNVGEVKGVTFVGTIISKQYLMENIVLGEQWVEVSLYQHCTCSLNRKHLATFSELCTKSEAVNTPNFTWYYKTLFVFI